MARTDILSETNSIVFSAISTPRRIRLYALPPSALVRPWDFLSVAHRTDGIVYVALNGATAASTAATTVQIASSKTPTFAVFKTAPLSIFTQATSLSIASQGTAATVEILLGRF